ncbi:cellulose-binding family II [Cellulomonas flavigena DSM 20109]|uniref:Cellulose-binding family II n=1 Tax=Cellulomonas flavigena (strain ATCC 482 / DSM 20109 / BCRC 11376 / JCM 18109 / NBRC 3775 / NCIMB 8073 / NRS 134) TaxID=446466 RepID=D5ULU5_CELFN|nr:cellulose binding domain-containing protein [Cellulomonas flavigena]ADG76051.1 cellulose-binding family II [Cellulomonas flavigena DSM 20109]
MHRPRRPAAVALTALTASVALVLTGAATQLPAAAADQPAPIADTVHAVGRVKAVSGGLAYSWPGVAFEGRFRGTGVGVVLDDGNADYDLFVDGRRRAHWILPGQGTKFVTGLADGEHTVRLVKRNESPWATSTFGGFVPWTGGEILEAPAPRQVQLEFYGDSYTAGYGNESRTRECTGDEVNRTTNADAAFPAIVGRAVGADVHVNAFSGRGMVRNYAGSDLGTSFRTYADRALLAVPGDAWQRPADWQPQVVVVGLGINDFSTAVGAGEPWSEQTLRTQFRAAYDGFVDSLRRSYGPDTFIVLSAPDHTPDIRTTTVAIAQDRLAAGDDRVIPWAFGGLDLTGCHWHPSTADHVTIAASLSQLVTSVLSVDGITPTPEPEPFRPIQPDASPEPAPTGNPSATPSPPTGYPTPTPTGPTHPTDPPSPTAPPSPTPTPTDVPTAPPGASCTAALAVTATWPGGYQAKVDVTAGSRPLGGWSVTFTLPGSLTQGWSGEFAASGSAVTVSNASWNGALGGGTTTSAGFIGSGTPPTSGAVPCTGVPAT